MLQIQTLQQTQTSCFCCCWLCQTMGEPVRVDVDAVPADFRFKGVFRKNDRVGSKSIVAPLGFEKGKERCHFLQNRSLQYILLPNRSFFCLHKGAKIAGFRARFFYKKLRLSAEFLLVPTKRKIFALQKFWSDSRA